MKRIISLMFAIALTTGVFAQQLSVKAGLNFANMSEDNTDMKLGFNVGVGAEFEINNLIRFEPGLLLTTKGFKADNWASDYKVNLLYLEIPLNAKAYFNAGSLKLYGLLGPYVGIGLTGKIKYEDDNLDDDDIDWGSDNGELKRLDFGLNIGAGIDLGQFQVGLQYGLGLVDLGYSDSHRVFSINAGYKF